jgi:hypothetical protein
VEVRAVSVVHPFDPQWKFVQSTNFQRVDPAKPRVVSLLVVHSMESPDKPSVAEAVAGWFARPNPLPGQPRDPAKHSPSASAHACVDCDSVVTCVMPQDISWSCSGGNWVSYGIEFAGYAKWLRVAWLSDANLAMIKLGAAHMAKAAVYFGIPAQIPSEAEVAECLRDACIRQGKLKGELSGNVGGVTTHAVVNAAWKNWAKHGLPQPGPKVGLSHYDPGSGFPLDALVEMMHPSLVDTEPPPKAA